MFVLVINTYLAAALLKYWGLIKIFRSSKLSNEKALQISSTFKGSTTAYSIK